MRAQGRAAQRPLRHWHAPEVPGAYICACARAAALVGVLACAKSQCATSARPPRGSAPAGAGGAGPPIRFCGSGARPDMIPRPEAPIGYAL